ncbi:UNVERIFIED_CONTAM: hypothetical protein GTU68_007978 [Idotea baltica]|nr:hypothetical protein [Idotea baltica]
MTNQLTSHAIEAAFEAAKDRYAELGVDVDVALKAVGKVAVSVHCWQGDDVGGFEHDAEALGGGIAVTGNYPGKARSIDELRSDLEKSYSLIPGSHRLNLHAIYGEFTAPTDRDQVGPEHFQGWIQWAGQQNVGLDFNPTFFSHENAADGFTLSHPDAGIRQFWIEHGIASRQIGAAMGAALETPCVTNFWVPDGYKDTPVDRTAPRRRLSESLDTIFDMPIDPLHNLDAVECKLFGIGSESYVAGSHEFYLGYALSRKKLLCLDAGHFHPTEVISDKVSSVMQYVDEILLHVSRGVRWDSDHVVTYSDELQAIAQEIVRGNYLDRVHIGLDFFDASINRVAAWVIGTRNMIKAVLAALLEPIEKLKQFEADGDYTSRLAILEELKTMPMGAVWDYYCMKSGVPVGSDWLAEVKQYERDFLSTRDTVSAKSCAAV